MVMYMSAWKASIVSLPRRVYGDVNGPRTVNHRLGLCGSCQPGNAPEVRRARSEEPDVAG